MKKFLLATVMSLALIASASAKQTVILSCVNPDVDNPEGDMIGVGITVNTSFRDPYFKITSFEVVHRVDGVEYSRSDQYHNRQTNHIDGQMDFRWIGTSNKNHNTKMVGRAWWNDTDGWQYKEVAQTGNEPVEVATPDVPCKEVSVK